MASACAAAEDAHPALVDGSSSDEDEPVLVDASLLVDASPDQPGFSLINVDEVSRSPAPAAKT